jgi:hypothetical protein
MVSRQTPEEVLNSSFPVEQSGNPDLGAKRVERLEAERGESGFEFNALWIFAFAGITKTG